MAWCEKPYYKILITICIGVSFYVVCTMLQLCTRALCIIFPVDYCSHCKVDQENKINPSDGRKKSPKKKNCVKTRTRQLQAAGLQLAMTRYTVALIPAALK